jgi:hypothetical protein
VSDTPDTDGLYNSLLAENPNNPIYLEVMLQHTRELERERNELVGVIKSLRKNAKEDAAKISLSVELVKLLVLQIEYPAYTVDDAVSKMFLMENAKKFINEMS